MSDEIDIEEHDLLDNPTIRRIFPDLSIIKKEISQYEEGLNTAIEGSTSEVTAASEAEVELTDYQHGESVMCKTEDSNTQKNTQQIDKDSQLEVHLRFKTFLDSLADDGLENSDDSLSNTFDDIVSSSPKIQSVEFVKNQNRQNLKSLCNNIFILGSKPNSPHPQSHRETKRTEKRQLKIELKNVWPYLKASKQYCKQCFILFPHIEALNCHTKNIHSFKNSDSLKQKKKQKNTTFKFTTDNYRCNICEVTLCSKGNLVRHLKTVHDTVDLYLSKRPRLSKQKTEKALQKEKNTKLDESSYCFHCHKEFESQSSLIEHLYDVLKPNKEEEALRNSNKNLNAEETRTMHHKTEDNVNNKEDTKLNSNSTSSKVIDNDLQKTYSPFKVLIESKVTENVQKKPNEVTGNNERFTRKQRASESETIGPNLRVSNGRDKVENSTNIFSMQKIQAYQCYICSQYMKYWKRYINHMGGHNIKNLIAADTVIFDSQCQFCDVKMSYEIRRYNSHVSNFHRERIYKKINTEEKAFPSVLFKCLKCELCFLTAEASRKHSEHVAIFVNWKCPDCHKLFKINDRAAHLKQHLLSKNITVYALCDSALDRILYKCLSCAVHFSEKEYLSHYATCTLKVPNSTYCKACDILINKNDIVLHELKHKDEKLQLKDFTVIESDIIRTARAQNREIKHIPLIKSKFALTFCSKCNCFLGDHGRKSKAHIGGRCTAINPRMCRKCGLIFTFRGYLSHKMLHDKVKNLNLQSFYFYDIKTEKQIRPPIPKYPKCGICEVHFLGKKYIQEHLCTKQNSVTCNFCKIQLTGTAFKLHINFHHYKLSCTRLSYDKKANYNTDNMITSTTDNDNVPMTLISTKTEKCTILRSTLKGIKSSSSEVEETVTSTNNFDNSSARNDISNVSEKTNINDTSLLYTCILCQTTVDMYDKAVEHCHEHYDHKKSPLRHENKLFDDNFNENVSTLIKFDPFYIRFDKDIWIQHIFGKLSSEHVAYILEHSKYKFECRLKMEEVQRGSHSIVNDSTLYKCEICRSYVEPNELYAHVGTKCTVIRKYPCSVCGLCFASESYKNVHEKTHESQDFIKDKGSYKIMIFNKQVHHQFVEMMVASRNKFILYQCRNCEVVIDKLHRVVHQCSRVELIKCSYCGLLFYDKDLDSHIIKHELIKQFQTEKMIVIMFGKLGCKRYNKVEPSFKGTIYDFTYFKCTTCGLCFKTKNSNYKHVCVPNSYESQCPKCCLSFLKKDIEEHLQIHENLPELAEDEFNSNIISYSKNTVVKDTSLNEIQVELDKESNINSLINDNMTQKIYKCGCGLHFLEELNAKKHLLNCNPRRKISKQNCFRCDLLFTPGELFNHLLKHHSNKKLQYRYDIISVLEAGENENNYIL